MGGGDAAVDGAGGVALVRTGQGSNLAGGDMSISSGRGGHISGDGGDFVATAGHAMADDSLGGNVNIMPGKFKGATSASVSEEASTGGQLQLKDSQGVTHMVLNSAKHSIIGRHADAADTDTRVGFFKATPINRQQATSMVSVNPEQMLGLD